jgi:3-dehydroquinate synthase
MDYPVMIDNSFLNKLPGILKDIGICNRLFIVIDENVYKYHKKIIENNISDFGEKIHYYILPPGEKSKSNTHLKMIYNSLLENNFGRDTALIAIGGGVIGDIAGYAAATYMRGIQLVNVPTTLLSMIDSSIGGKTGINFLKRKNIVGVFYQPELVFIDTGFLNTLPESELNSSLGELIKYGLISNDNFFRFILNNIEKIKSLDKKFVAKVITESVSIKAAIVSQDEFETNGIRKILNLGHTFAHAIESNLNFKIKHGEAVVIGIICALYLSPYKRLLNHKELERLLSLPLSVNIPRVAEKLNNNAIIQMMLSDKKNIDDKIMFVLLAGTGKVVVDVPVEKDTINMVLERVKNSGFI